tara:strand:+ start:1950 stop:2090 length:141 start_codon:yes stop_codon:yes gene_type:complete
MNPIITLTVLIVFIGVMSEIIHRVLSDYSDGHPIIPEPNNLLGEEE